MKEKLRVILIISAKQAVNAILTNSALMALIPQTFHLRNAQGILHIGEAALSVIAAREAMVWLPKLLAWTQSKTNGEQ